MAVLNSIMVSQDMKHAHVGMRDYDDDGTFSHIYTNESISASDDFLWATGEPDVSLGHDCTYLTQLFHEEKGLTDMLCDNSLKRPFICQWFGNTALPLKN